MADEVVDVLQEVVREVSPQADLLRELDAKIGDGDLGVTIKKGLAAVDEGLADLRGQPVSDQLVRSGMSFNRAAASTFGALFATAFMRAGKAVSGRDDVSWADIVPIGRAALQGVMERGKASLGDKTLIDALAPAIDAFEEAQMAGQSLLEATDAAAEACDAGTKATIEMQSRVSRASWMGERSIGVQDPGATAVLLMVRAAQRWVRENAE